MSRLFAWERPDPRLHSSTRRRFLHDYARLPFAEWKPNGAEAVEAEARIWRVGIRVRVRKGPVEGDVARQCTV